MVLYPYALFLHILGAFGLIAALGIETVALRGLRGAGTAEQAHPWLGAMQVLRIMGPASIALILVMGLYLTATAWGWRGWIVSGLTGLVLVALIGGLLTGTRMVRLGPAIGRAQGPLANAERRLLRDPSLLLSSRLRITLVLGVLYLMSVKPSTLISILVLVIAVALGVVVSQMEARRNQDELPAQAS
jgi:hypothetical protein